VFWQGSGSLYFNQYRIINSSLDQYYLIKPLTQYENHSLIRQWPLILMWLVWALC